MSKLISNVTSFIKDEEGQGMVEYGLIIAGIALAAIAAIGLFGGQISTFFTDLKLTPTGA